MSIHLHLQISSSISSDFCLDLSNINKYSKNHQFCLLQFSQLKVGQKSVKSCLKISSFDFRQMDRRTDICNSRVAFLTEK